MADPATVTATDSLVTTLVGQAVAGLLLIPVIWYMLRDLKTNVALLKAELEDGMRSMAKKLHELELSVAGDGTKHDVRHLKEGFAELKKTLEAMQLQTSHTERSLAAAWGKIGDRPEDIRNRGGT